MTTLKKDEITISKIAVIGAIVEEAERMKGAYFYTPPCNASGRRSYEKQHSHDEVEWTDGNDIYTAKFETSCTCNSVYASGTYTKNGKKTTLTAIRNSYKRLLGETNKNEK